MFWKLSEEISSELEDRSQAMLRWNVETRGETWHWPLVMRRTLVILKRTAFGWRKQMKSLNETGLEMGEELEWAGTANSSSVAFPDSWGRTQFSVHRKWGLNVYCPRKERVTYLFLIRWDFWKVPSLSTYLAFESKVTEFLFNLVAVLDFSSNRFP